MQMDFFLFSVKLKANFQQSAQVFNEGTSSEHKTASNGLSQP